MSRATGRATAAACPCGTGVAYSRCCGPRHRGTVPAATAEELMRSRYSAYAKRMADYLLTTWAPETRPSELVLDPALRWTRLEVLRTEAGGTGDDVGTVEFAAHHERGGVADVLTEVSRFRRDDRGAWVYVDGTR